MACSRRSIKRARSSAFTRVNGVEGYADYGVSIAKDGFSFAVTGTNLDDDGADALDNDAVKFTVAYSMDFEL